MCLRSEDSLRISAGFLLLTIWFAAVNGWRLLFMILGAAAVHELGHLWMLRLLGARIFGNLKLSGEGAEKAVRNTKVPILLVHGADDDFVPCEMSRVNYAACASRKKLVLVPNAGHGLSYPMDPGLYLAAARTFFGPEASYFTEENVPIAQ